MAVEKDLSGRAAELAAKSTSGTLSQEEQTEYEHIVRLNDLLSILKLQAEEDLGTTYSLITMAEPRRTRI